MHSRGTLNSQHNAHDRVLVARYAAGDAYAAETDLAQSLVDNCDECAFLAADIRLIAARMHELPAVHRPRDFRIAPEQADKLRGSWFDRLMRGLSMPGWGVARPLAGAAMAIGIALVVVGALPISNLTGGAAQDVNPNSASQAANAPSTVPVAALPQTPETTKATAEDTSGRGPATAPQTPASPEYNTTPTSVPGVDVHEPTFSGDLSAQSQAPVSAPTAPPPPKAFESPATAPATASSAGAANVVPSAAPSPPPVPAAPAHATIAVGTVSTSDSSLLVVGGMLIAFLALLVIGLVTVARRRYSDPLVR